MELLKYDIALLALKKKRNNLNIAINQDIKKSPRRGFIFG